MHKDKKPTQKKAKQKNNHKNKSLQAERIIKLHLMLLHMGLATSTILMEDWW